MLLHEDSSFACYSLPGSTNFELIQGEILKLPICELPHESGFLIAEFENNRQAYFLSCSTKKTNPTFTFDATHNFNMVNITESNYLDLCKDYITYCQLNLSKIVLSRIKTIPVSLRADRLFHAFKNAYPNAFVYLINSPEFGTWIGATPEILLKRKFNQYTTIALAGTKPLIGNTQWTSKEKNEQQLVTDFILDELKNLKIEASSVGPTTVNAGNLQHICTHLDFKTETERCKIINALHPTPAVCGLPPREAKEKIMTSELHSRELYTGFLGPINFDNKDHLYVNLRCLKANNKQLHIYAGGGITADSNPMDEWNETELKVQTLLGVIEKL
ncbi:MAG: chorismate-binding protein [Flavobacteriales bacterium]|nr:chorismate-binding protein [Flavobacteriales bacterium]